MFKPLIILGLSLTFVGCATNSSQQAATNNAATEKVAEKDDSKKVICKKEARVGSHFKKTQCWTVADYKAKQERDRQKMQDIQANSTRMKPPTSK